VPDGPEGKDEEQVQGWRAVFDAEYTVDEDAEIAELGSDFGLWKQSQDGLAFPAGHMHEWLATTVESIRELRPRRVLEVGVGTGLLLAELAGGCDSYWGTDLSLEVITALRRQVSRAPELADRVRLRHQDAGDVTGLPSDYFDTVVINSVVQYFPGGQYLLDGDPQEGSFHLV